MIKPTLAWIAVLLNLSAHARIVYVDSAATGVTNGTSWQNAYPDLQSALSIAVAFDSIWVAKGTYYPTSGSSRTLSFVMRDSVKLLGGFSGTENSICARDWIANRTILSGDIGVLGDSTDNSYHVIFADQVYNQALLDGFTIRDGNADLAAMGHDYGGGMKLESAEFPIRNCLITHNHAKQGAGGIYLNQCQELAFENCIFEYNDSPNGGGLYLNWCVGNIRACTFRYNTSRLGAGGLMGSVGGLDITDCEFYGNVATVGAGAGLAVNFWAGTMRNCRFEDNVSVTTGGGLDMVQSRGRLVKCQFINNTTTQVNDPTHGGGGLAVDNFPGGYKLEIDGCSFIGNVSGCAGGGCKLDYSPMRLTNTIFSGNQANLDGGGLYYLSGPDSLWIFNCTFANNISGTGGGGLYNYNVWFAPPVWNTIFWNNSPNQVQDQVNTNHPAILEHCIVTGGYPGTGNLNVNPLFEDADGLDNAVGTVDDNLRLSLNSPAIQAGKPDTVGTFLPPVDHKLEPRILEDTVDIGAYEGPGCGGAVPVVHSGTDTSFCGNIFAMNALAPAFGCAFWETGSGCYIIRDPYSPFSTVTFGGYGVHTLVWQVSFCDTVLRDTVLVTNYPIPESPTIMINGQAQFCAGDSAVLSLPSGYSSYSWSSGDTTPQIIVDSSASYTAQVTTSAGCTSPPSSPFSVTEFPLPPPPVLSPPGPLEACQGDVIGLAGPGGYASYAWSTGDTALSIQLTSSAIVFLTVTDSNGCQSPSSAPVSLNVHPLPAIPIVQIGGSNPICPGATLDLIGPPGYTGYGWNNGGISQVITIGTMGTYTLVVIDSNGCQSLPSIPVSVQAHPLLAPTISLIGDSITCPGDSAVLMGPAGYSNYQWSNGDTTFSTVVSQPGIYTLSLNDSNNCPSAVSNAITFNNFPVPPQAVIVPGRDTVLCAGESVLIAALPNGMSYQWSNGSTAPGFNVSGNGQYSVIVTDPNGCISEPSDTMRIRFQPEPAVPQITALGPVEFCEGETVTLSVTPASLVSYSWSNGATGTSLTVSGDGNFSVIGFDSLGCVSDSSATVTVAVFSTPSTPIIISDASGAECAGDSVRLFGPPGYAAYFWSNGSTGEWIVADSTVTVQLSVVDSLGCASDTSNAYSVDFVAIPEAPDLMVNSSIVQCSDQPLLLNAPGGFAHYLWSTGDTSQSIKVLSTGAYWLAIGYSIHCMSTHSDTVHVSIGTEKVFDGETVSLYPVPNDGHFHLRLPGMKEAEIEMQIYDAIGKRLFETAFDLRDCQPQDYPIDLENVAAGIYFCRLSLKNQVVVLRFEVRW